ncbi:MAG: type II toxin-antitoxin system RelE/ParE family toxin [Bacteroidales bacterium]|nr:type II toxin-antitoxin system RelE/ParE family toxin [Bacteroidales bacterium]
MALALQWNTSAIASFYKTVVYLENEWGINAAIRFVRKVNHILFLLQSYPEIGRPENPKTDLFSVVITHQTTLFYRMKSDKIILLMFFDTRRSPTRKPKQ